MKTNTTVPSRQQSAFTLIELLIVITITALLAGFVSSAALSTLRRAREVEAMGYVRSTQLALRDYEAEYNRLPTTTLASSQGAIELAAGNPLLPALLGLDLDRLNPKRIAFLELPQGKAGSSGLVGDVGSLALLDPWGQPLRVGSGSLANPDKINSDSNIAEHAASRLLTRVAVFSLGADRQAHTADDIVSWRH
jgi:prepilin-type N-terminal cleavage/methylation domain-containing protein